MAGLSNPRVVMYRRCNDRARSVYSMTPNVPMQGEAAPLECAVLVAQPDADVLVFVGAGTVDGKTGRHN